jgi:multidrug efflux pump subunit AcrA (membrane-fusion protein)
LHGLTEEQIDTIISSRLLIQETTMRAPARQEPSRTAPLQVASLETSHGQFVNTGDTLCVLMDHSELYIEGKAFEQDVEAVTKAASADAHVSALLGAKATSGAEVLEKLKILYVDDSVDRESRTLRFYIALANRLVREDKRPDGRRFIYWQFKVGQRLQIKVPVDRWEEKIVLPAAAVARDGAEFYVFEANAGHFDRRTVHVEYRDEQWVVIANDGTLTPGKQVAASAAHQMQLAIKNKSGGGVDPHAGHNH